MERKIFDIPQYSFAMSLLSPLAVLRVPSFEQTNMKNLYFVPSLVEIGPALGCIFAILILSELEKDVTLHMFNLNLNNILNDINALSLYISI